VAARSEGGLGVREVVSCSGEAKSSDAQHGSTEVARMPDSLGVFFRPSGRPRLALRARTSPTVGCAGSAWLWTAVGGWEKRGGGRCPRGRVLLGRGGERRRAARLG
jgi:hypothetical protein